MMGYRRRLGGFIWLPRIIIIVMALFLMIFSFDVFEMQGSLLDKAAGFIVHSLPSLSILVSVIITWRSPKAAAILFTSAGVLIIGIEAVMFFIQNNPSAIMSPRIIIFTPLIVAGLLFIIADKKAAKPKWFG